MESLTHAISDYGGNSSIVRAETLRNSHVGGVQILMWKSTPLSLSARSNFTDLRAMRKEVEAFAIQQLVSVPNGMKLQQIFSPVISSTA